MYRNNEYYPDPTFASAYMNIKKETAKNNGETYMPWVYIASPLRGDMERNIENAKEYCRFAIQQNVLPMCPCTAKKGGQPKAGFCEAKVLSIIYFTLFLNDSEEIERRIGLMLGLQMLKRCKEVWVFGGRISEGMANEIKIAEKRKIPVRYFTAECREVNGL